MEATLVGTVCEPALRLTFEKTATHPVTGARLVDWVKSLPGRRWSPEDTAWFVTGIGPEAAEDLFEAGFETYAVEIAGPVSGIDDVLHPVVDLCPDRAGAVRLWPRLFGYDATRDLLGDTGAWQRGHGHWIVPIRVFVDGGPAGIEVPDEVVESARRQAAAAEQIGDVVAEVASSNGLDGVSGGSMVVDAVGDVPAWFGLELDQYQRAGAVAIVGGHTMLADEPGLGKTRQALAAAAIVGSARTVIVCPPVVATSWQREASTSGLATLGGLAPPSTSATSPDVSSIAGSASNPVPPAGDIVVIRAGRKVPPIPERGVVIVPDTLLAARPALVDELVAWNPMVVMVDEAHREKTWVSKRSRAVRQLAAAATRLPIAITGTPLFANPVELASPLAIAGHLDGTFGGYGSFTSTYAKRNHFKQWIPRKENLPLLRSELNAHVWVRRTKADVLSELPKKSRRAKFVDVDPSHYRQAHSEVCAEIDAWLAEFTVPPANQEIVDWCRSSVGMVTRLRRAAGVAKVPVAADMLAEWVESTMVTNPDGTVTYPRPVVVWTHHREVSEAMAEAIPEAVGEAGCILGGTPHDERTALVDAFQAGLIPVLVCSIHAAGVGITLTRASDVIFVETDWTPAIVSQAEDRCHRRGQTQPVTITTLIAPDTLDERVQAILARKIGILDVVLEGADHDVAVLDANLDNTIAPAEILETLVWERIAARQRKRKAA